MRGRRPSDNLTQDETAYTPQHSDARDGEKVAPQYSTYGHPCGAHFPNSVAPRAAVSAPRTSVEMDSGASVHLLSAWRLAFTIVFDEDGIDPKLLSNAFVVPPLAQDEEAVFLVSVHRSKTIIIEASSPASKDANPDAGCHHDPLLLGSTRSSRGECLRVRLPSSHASPFS